MSKFSTVYDQIRTTLGVLFPDKKEFTNTDQLLENNDLFLEDGYGVKIGNASPLPFDFTEFLEGREFTIIFTQELKSLECSKDIIVATKKEMIEDTVTLKKDFLANDQIGVASSVQIIELSTSTGIDFIPGSDKYLTTEVTFIFGISELINT